MAYRGVHLSYETIRRWCDTLGTSYAAKLRRKQPKLGDKDSVRTDGGDLEVNVEEV
jgi:transposase-like protein